MSSPKWGKITDKHYNFTGKFKAKALYEGIKEYLNDHLYDLVEDELEMGNIDGKVNIFGHVQGDLEWSRRFYIKLAFSIKIDGKLLDDKSGMVDGSLSFSVNGFLQSHSLLHEKKSNAFTKFLTKFYDTYIDRAERNDAIVSTVIEMIKIVAEVKKRVERR